MTRPFQYHTSRIFLQAYFHRDGKDRNVTNIAHVCANFVARIFCYRRILSWSCWEISWRIPILDPRCMHWIWILHFSDLFGFLFVHYRDIVGKSSFFSSLTIENYLFAQHRAFIGIGSYLLTYIEGRLLSLSATFFSIPDICWILESNSLIVSHHLINCWDSLRVAAYTRFLWSKNTLIS